MCAQITEELRFFKLESCITSQTPQSNFGAWSLRDYSFFHAIDAQLLRKTYEDADDKNECST